MEHSLVRTYDIINCGPRHRYAVRGKVVSNSSLGVQLQNLSRDVLEEPEQAILDVIGGRPLDDAAGTLKRLVRATITHPSGITSGDFSNIEGRMAPWLEGGPMGESKLDVFRKGLDPYIVLAQQMFHVSYEAVTADQRQGGKVAELACFAADTRVLTDSGIKAIVDVGQGDKLWDGVEWVSHQGVICKGQRETINLSGLQVTPDHMFLVNELWVAAASLAPDAPSAGARTVFDIMNCGPRNRFTVISDDGPMIAHNCQFGGGIGALQSMGSNYGLKLSDDYAAVLRDGWRAANPWMSRMLHLLGTATRRALRSPGEWFEAGRVAYAYDGSDWMWCRLPSGRLLAYFQPRIEQVITPWGEEVLGITALWGARRPKAGEEWTRRTLTPSLLLENITQAASACVLRYALSKCNARGIEVVAHVHDEIVAVNTNSDELRQAMLDQPAWLQGLVIPVKVTHDQHYGK